MKKLVATALLLIITNCFADKTNLNLMTFNLPSCYKYLPLPCECLKKLIGRQLWKSDSRDRIRATVALLALYTPDIIGFQETPSEDLNYLVRHSKDSKSYGWYGKAARPNDTGDINGIMYDNNRFTRLEEETIWLNKDQTPYKKGWGGNHLRTVTFVKFNNNKTQETFWVINTHLSLHSSVRKHELQLIRTLADQKIKSEELIFLIGDFNARPTSPSLKKYLLSTFQFMKDIAQKTEGPEYTYPSNPHHDSKSEKAIDHLFVNDKQKVTVNLFDVITFEHDGTRPSDHYQVKANLTIH